MKKASVVTNIWFTNWFTTLMDTKELFEIMMHQSYYTARELKYKKDPGLLISPYGHKKLLEYFDEEAKKHESVIDLKLESFTGAGLRISLCDDLTSLFTDYLSLVKEDASENRAFLLFRDIDAITKSKILSEIEGTLNIESVKTNRKTLHNIVINGKAPANRNEQIIHNMAKAIEYVNSCPEFNKDNLFKLYSTLSNCCLDEEDKLLPDHIYRHDSVEIDNYQGCPHEKIESCMDSLFEFINTNLNNHKIRLFLPHIAHYYIGYIHPYFDFNGRTARMVSYWIYLLLNNGAMPPVISEAVNQLKNEYYASLRETRDSHNDITYFLLYIFKVSIKYFLTYKNIECIDAELKNKSIVLTETNKTYMKKILISSKGKFTYEDFVKWSNSDMSKQAAFKILNEFESIGFLTSETNKSNKKLFEVNESEIQYKAF